MENSDLIMSKKVNNRYCSVPQCCNKGSSSSVSFHKFPSNLKYKQKWVVALKIGKLVSKYMVVCSDHFKAEDFFFCDVPTDAAITLGRRRLKRTSVPSCKLPTRTCERPVSSGNLVSKRNRANRAAKRLCQVTPITSIHGPDEYCQDSARPTNDIEHDEATAVEALLELQTLAGKEPSADNAKTYSDVACQVSGQMIHGKEHPTLIDMIHTDADLNAFTGIATLRQLHNICEAAEMLQEKSVGTRGCEDNLQLDITERIVLTLVKIKLNMSFKCIAVLFNISNTTTIKYFHLTLTLLSSLMEEMIVWPSKEDVIRNMPACFAKYKCTRVVLDCTEVSVEKPCCLKCRLCTYSHYKGTNTVKFLIGVAPEGLVTFRSKAYGGRASDKIFLQSGLMGKLHPHIDAIMSDKGFLVEHECTLNGIKLIRPPFLGKASQFSVAEGQQTAEIAQARVHVERAIQRLKVFKILKHQLAWNLVPCIDDIMTIVVGLVNLSKPILASDKF